MEMKCPKCKKEWDYKGKVKPKNYPQFITCPRCRYNIKIQNEK